MADQRALRAARRFPIRYRARMYFDFCTYGERLIQLAEAFPLLALELTGGLGDWAMRDQNRQRHIELVLAGVTLKRISDSLGIPYLLRHVTPGATKYVHTTKISNEILRRIPPTTRKQRAFFHAIRITQGLGEDFTMWSAKQSANMNPEEVWEFLDIGDWVEACEPNEILNRSPNVVLSGASFVTRRFTRAMSLKTVRRLSQEWHEAVANNLPEGQLIRFPAPWLCGGEIGVYKIVPITDSRALYLAAKRLHNRAVTYADGIVRGEICLYTVQDRDERPVVMVAIARINGGIELLKIKGPCNAAAPKDIENAVRRWFKRNKEATFKKAAASSHLAPVGEAPF